MTTYERTENGVATRVTEEEALTEGRAAMLDRVTERAHVRKIYNDRGRYDITYTDDRHVLLAPVDVESELTAELAIEADEDGYDEPAARESGRQWGMEHAHYVSTTGEGPLSKGVPQAPHRFADCEGAWQAAYVEGVAAYQADQETESPACEGHSGEDDDLLAGANIGETTYCDGSCNPEADDKDDEPVGDAGTGHGSYEYWSGQ